MEGKDIKELEGKDIKVILDDFRQTIFHCRILTYGEDYIKIKDKYGTVHFIKIPMIKYIGEVTQ